MEIEARSPGEAIDFVKRRSAGSSTGGMVWCTVLDRGVPDAWRSVSAGDGRRAARHRPSLPPDKEPELIAEAVRQGHRTLVSSSEAAREMVSSHPTPACLSPRPGEGAGVV